MAYQWSEPDTATFKIDVGAVNGEISDSVAAEGTKSITLGAVPNNAVFQRFIDGGDGNTPVSNGTFGVIPIFFTYILGVSAFDSSAKKTLTVDVEEDE